MFNTDEIRLAVNGSRLVWCDSTPLFEHVISLSEALNECWSIYFLNSIMGAVLHIY